MREITSDENSREEGYAAGKKEAMTEPTRRYEQLEGDLKFAKNQVANRDLWLKIRDVRIEELKAENARIRAELGAAKLTWDATSLSWKDGYNHGLRQCNHHPEAPENWAYTRENHDTLDKIADKISEQAADLQQALTAIETLR